MLGYNYRLTDLQAALGTSQLSKLELFVDRRRLLADRYRAGLAGLRVKLPPEPGLGFTHAYHLFPIRVADRGAVLDTLQSAGIAAQVHYVPIYRHPLYRDLGVDAASFPATEAAYEEELSVPLHPSLSEEEQDHVVDALRSAL
jgi:dTDP-4-amino-4,6-dideoxygalactose transaminase